MRGVWCLLVFATLTAVPSVATGQEAPTEASPDDGEGDAAARAETLIAEGVALRRERKENEALERFRAAHKVHPTPRSAGQIGLASKSVRSYLDAERYLAEALAAADDAWVRKNREALTLAMSIVAKQLAWLEVAASVDNGVLFVNGTEVARLPLNEPLRVVAGELVVEVRAEGYRPWKAEATVSAEATQKFEAELQKVVPLPVPEPPPSVPAPVPEPEPAADPPPSWTPWIIGTGAAGGVGLVLGTAFGIRTLVLRDERDAVCPDIECDGDEGVELDRDARTMGTASTVAFAVGGVAAGVALVLFLVESDAPVVADAGGLGIRF